MSQVLVDKEQVNLFMQWSSRLMLEPHPNSPHALAVLAKADLKTKPMWFEVIRFTAFVGYQYGRFGTNIRPSQDRLAEDFNVSQKKVSRLFEAADGLGFFIRQQESTALRTTTVRQIAPFWERDLFVPSGVFVPAADDPWAEAATEPPPF